MSFYNLSGTVASVVFLLGLAGLYSQLSLIWRRRALFREGRLPPGEQITAVLSVNQGMSSFLAFYVFLLYGFALPERNDFLVGSRIPACVMLLMILFEIARDRRSRAAIICATAASGLFVGALGFGFFAIEFVRELYPFSQAVIVVVTVILGQGYLSQVLEMRRKGSPGAVAKRMHQLLLAKDITTVIFGIAMGFSQGWPVMLLCTVSGLTKVATLYQFRLLRLQGAHPCRSVPS